MLQRTPRNAIYYVLYSVQFVALLFIPLVGISIKLSDKHIAAASVWFAPLGGLLGYFQVEAWWLAVALALSVGVSKALCAWIGAPSVWATLQSMIDELRKHAFNASSDDPSHHHRVTLFRHKTWRFRVWPSRCRYRPWGRSWYPWSGWLVPILRSGHTTQRTNSVFLAPDRAQYAEGIAGQTWACNGTIFKDGLPDLNGSPSDEEIEQYAKQTFVSTDLIRKRMHEHQALSRSFCGIPVEVKNRPWGVIVLDSYSPNGIKRPRKQLAATYSVMAKFVGKLLERA